MRDLLWTYFSVNEWDLVALCCENLPIFQSDIHLGIVIDNSEDILDDDVFRGDLFKGIDILLIFQWHSICIVIKDNLESKVGIKACPHNYP